MRVHLAYGPACCLVPAVEEVVRESPPAAALTGKQLAASDLDAASIMRSISELSSLANELLRTIASQQNRRTASGETRVALQWQKFSAVKQLYSLEEYINPKAVQSVVGTATFHPVLCRANAAILAFFLFTAQEDANMFEDLKSLNRSFPALLGQPITKANFSLVLDLRTHSVIEGWRENRDASPFNPNDFISHFFYITDDAIKEYDGWPEAKRQRIRELGGYYGQDGIDFAGLAQKYPWQGFAEKMLAFLWIAIDDAGPWEPAIDKAKDKAKARAAEAAVNPPSTMNPRRGPAVKAKDPVSR